MKNAPKYENFIHRWLVIFLIIYKIIELQSISVKGQGTSILLRSQFKQKQKVVSIIDTYWQIRVFKLMLARLRQSNVDLQERQPITKRLQGISLKSSLRNFPQATIDEVSLSFCSAIILPCIDLTFLVLFALLSQALWRL